MLNALEELPGGSTKTLKNWLAWAARMNSRGGALRAATQAKEFARAAELTYVHGSGRESSYGRVSRAAHDNNMFAALCMLDDDGHVIDDMGEAAEKLVW